MPMTSATVLDGFVITAGYAAGGFDGGGMYCNGSGSGSNVQS
ncbi:MAG: hypothetical protein R2880_11125 [Deinococcales bacterium]